MQESRQMALKQTEDQVKQMRDDASMHTHVKGASVRSKLSSKVGAKSSREKAHPTGLSDQDIKAALGLVDESWARQEYRLQQYLQRNFNIANGIPTTMDVDEEEFERPNTATSLGKIIERVKIESTPTAEKDLQLGSATPEADYDITPLEKQLEMSFSHNRTTFPTTS